MGAITTRFAPATTKSRLSSPKRSDPIIAASSTGSSAIGPQWNGRVGKANVDQYRHWAKYSEWVRGAINIRRSQISSAEWSVVPFDKTRPYSKRLQQKVTDLMRNPNPQNDSFRTFIEPIVEDILVLDAGCVEKDRDLLGNLHHLWPVDGGAVRVNSMWDGSDPEETRYFWYPDYKQRATWKNRDFIYMMANRRTDSAVGLSPLESLKLTIEAELYGHEYNRRQVSGAAPDGVMDLGEGATTDDVRRYRAYFESEVAGRGAVGFVGGTKNAKWIPFRSTNRDMQFLEWQIYLVRKIAVVLGLTPQDLGVTFDVNRSTAETQIQISEDRGLRPLMSLIQDYITQEVVWDSTFGGPENNLAFRFTALNLKETTARAEINKLALAGVPWKTVDEARIDDGRQPLGGIFGTSLIMATPVGAVSLDKVPTAQDVVDAKKPPEKPTPPPDSSKAIREAIDESNATQRELITDAVGTFERRITDVQGSLMNSALRMAEAQAGRPIDVQVHAPVTIAEGAVQASFDPPDVNVEIHEAPRPKALMTEFVMDDEGRVTGKIEREIDDQ